MLQWTLDNNPPDEYARHHIKEGSFYGHDVWTDDLVTRLPAGAGAGADGRVKVNFVGIHEKAMWPGKRAERAEGGRAMALFEEMDGWLERTTGGAVDAMFLGCVGGVEVV